MLKKKNQIVIDQQEFSSTDSKMNKMSVIYFVSHIFYEHAKEKGDAKPVLDKHGGISGSCDPDSGKKP